MIRNNGLVWLRKSLALLILAAATAQGATSSPKLPVVPKWDRFEQAFRSTFVYTNALQEAALKVVFTSPMGETFAVDGFWDGGRTWRVRFSPDQPGRWKFHTTCSDEENAGLHQRDGEFICSAPIGITRFRKHGQVRVARDGRHLEHLDGTPFFWLADTVWNGPRVSDAKDWGVYAGVRAGQRFTVAQWAVAPGDDVKGQSAYTAFPDQIGVNPEVFQRLDQKLEILTQAGILSAIVPILDLPSQRHVAPPLPDAQAELLVRYIVARWGAEPVVWLLAFEGDGDGGNVGRWRRIGRSVFGSHAHAPVMLYPGETQWVLDEFRQEKWVDMFGYQAITGFSDDALKWTFNGPFMGEWKKEPARPLIVFAPYENGVTGRGANRNTSGDVRRALYWSLLLTPPAGVSYGAQGVVDWDLTCGPLASENQSGDLPMWRKAMFMPVAKQMATLANLMNSVEYWNLRPQQSALATQPGDKWPRSYTVAAANRDNSLSVIYVAEARTLEVSLKGLPRSPSISWLNPASGERKAGVAVVTGDSYQFPTPEPGDWLLVTKSGK